MDFYIVCEKYVLLIWNLILKDSYTFSPMMDYLIYLSRILRTDDR